MDDRRACKDEAGLEQSGTYILPWLSSRGHSTPCSPPSDSSVSPFTKGGWCDTCHITPTLNASVEIKFMDVPDAGYLSSNDPPQGEVCIEGRL